MPKGQVQVLWSYELGLTKRLTCIIVMYYIKYVCSTIDPLFVVFSSYGQ